MSSLTPSPSGTSNYADGLTAATASANRHRFVTSQNPEDLVAARYLQRLGNTFVRKASPDPADPFPASDGRASSFRIKRTGSRPSSGKAATSTTGLGTAAAPLTSAVLPTSSARGEDGAAATRRWRTQVASPTDTLTSPASPSQGNNFDFPLPMAGHGQHRSTSPQSPAPPNADGREGSAQSVGRGGKPLRRGLSSSHVAADKAELSSFAQDPPSPHNAAGGNRSVLLQHGTNNASNSRSGAPGGGMKRMGDPHKVTGTGNQDAFATSKLLASGRGTASTYKEAALRANTAVSQAAALMAVGAPAPRKVRTEEERNALVLAQEHSKVMLLVGRRANLETDIEDMLELADEYEKEMQESRRYIVSPAAAAGKEQQPSLNSTATFTGDRVARKRGGSASSMADVDAQLSVEAGVVRRRMRQLLTNLLGNGVLGSAGGGTTLDAASLNRLVQQLQSQLDLVEGALADKLEETEEEELDKIEASNAAVAAAASEQNARMRAVSTTSSLAAMTQPAPVLTLLQKRKRAFQRRQADAQDASSNQERMEWLMECVDAELLTDVPAEQRAATVSGAAGAPEEASTPPASSRITRRPHDVEREEAGLTRRQHTASPDGFASVLHLSPEAPMPGDALGDSALFYSRGTTVSQPSMVPFSLSSSVAHGEGADDARTPTSTLKGLNLLGFMTEVLAQYTLSMDETTEPRRKRPLTAPSANALAGSRGHNALRDRSKNDAPTGTVAGDGMSPGDDPLHDGSGGQQGGKRGSQSSDGGEVYMHFSPTDRDDDPGAPFKPSRDTAAKRQQHQQQLLASSNTGGGGRGNAAGSAGNGSGKPPTLLGAQLRNLRTGLLQDLHELCSLYDYMHLIDERRRELLHGAGEKGADDYDAELEQRLEEHRLQQEAVQRARDEERRRKAESDDLDTFGLGGGGSGSSPRGAAETRLSPQLPTSEPSPPAQKKQLPAGPEAATPEPAAPRQPLEEPKPSEEHSSAINEETSGLVEVETELTREVVSEGQLVFTLVGVSAAGRVTSAATPGAAAVAPEDGKVKGGKKKGAAGGSAAGRSAENYLRYELRVERTGSVPSAEAATAEAPTSALAVVTINPRRLVNLKLAPASNVSVVNKNKLSIVRAVVEDGAAPQFLLSLVPVKRYKTSSFAKAFEYSAAPADATVNHTDDPNGSNEDGGDSRASSTASMPFAVPAPGETHSRSSSLDSGALLTVAASPANEDGDGVEQPPTFGGELSATKDDAEQQSSSMTGLKKTKKTGTGGKKTAARASATTAAKSGKAKTSLDTASRQENASMTASRTDQGSTTALRAKEAGKDKPSASPELKSGSLHGVPKLPSLFGKQSTPSPTNTPPPSPPPRMLSTAEQTSTTKASGVLPPLTTATPNVSHASLPAAPPLQDQPRPIEDWGTAQHTNLEMEAVENNAVVLTVLWAEEEEPPQTPPSRQELLSALTSAKNVAASVGDTSTMSAAEALLAAIPGGHESVVSEQPASPQSVSSIGKDSNVAAEVRRQQLSGSASAVIDAVATELLRQVMAEEEVATEKTANIGGESEGTLRENSVTGQLRSPLRGGEEMEGKVLSPVTPDGQTQPQQSEEGAEEVSGQPVPEPPSQPTPSTTPKKTQDSGTASGSSALPAGGTRKPDGLPSRTPAPQKKKLGGTKPAPSLTITSSQSRPMRAEEAQKYAGGIFHLDHDGESSVENSESATAAADAATGAQKASSPSAQSLRPASASPLDASHGRLPKPLVATSPMSQQQQHHVSSTSAGEHFSEYTSEEAVPPPPPIVVERKAGTSKLQVLLPQEAVTSILGPRVKSVVSSETSQATVKGGRSSERRSSQPGSSTSHKTATTTAAEESIREQFSVLPTTGAAAEAAADARTVTHVQTFLQAVMRNPKSKPSTNTSSSSSSARHRQVSIVSASRGDGSALKPAGAGTMGPLLSEVEQLQEEARQLFMLDPVRYDAVVSELMQQAADELQKELAQEQLRDGNNSSSSGGGGGGGSVREASHGLDSAALGLPPVLVTVSGADSHSGSASGHTTQHLPTNPLQSGSGDGELASSSGLGRTDFSSAIPHLYAHTRQGSSADKRASVAFESGTAGTSGGSQATSSGHDHSPHFLADGHVRLPSFVSPATGHGRRSTHALVMQGSTASGSKLNSSEAARRKSRADAVAEVERILYEQMKAKLLLRAIIDKMQALWQAKQRSVEEKNRGRVAQRMRRVVKRALAASWPIERQRVINLRKLIYLLDRQVGRVHGWLPHYSDTNVLTTATTSTAAAAASRTWRSSARTFVPFSAWYRSKDATGRLGGGGGGGGAVHDAVATGSTEDGACCDECPRYLRYLPQRRIYHYMRLAKSRRLMPLQLVRADVQECHSRHILLGYEKMPLDAAEEQAGDGAGSAAAPIHAGWPKRDLPRHLRMGRAPRGGYVPERYDDMQTRGERERYRRRLQGTAAFQGVSKMYSPRTRQDADLPFSLH